MKTKKTLYQMTVESISTLVLGALSILSIVALGFVCRVLWEGFFLGWTVFGVWL